ncbi:hypothetical protein RN001_014135 [Aquatica leii]|uniref:Condensin complex subunit 2 n=1 Tax=Aquatica leii TaxID=1421715 RepID=A0AAN7Q0H5_9COLE|nr:hypothetical protein RN001_014135 [Aquatica leii]
MVQTSTPVVQTPQRNNLRKSVLLKEVNNTSFSLRRLSNVAQQTPINQVVIDDDLERNLRRSEADLHKRVSNVGIQTPIKLSETEIREHFQICLKMFAENKISSKNAWNLKMIDYMRTVITLKGQAKDSLQVAGTSLDVSTKIYGIRVDDIHSDGLKLASNMARVNPENEEDDDGQDENDPDQTKRKGPKRKKPKSRGQKVTVTKDANTLVADVPKMESVFFQTRMDLEASSTDNLFTNKLPMHPSGYKFMLLSKERAWNSYDNLVDINENDYSMEVTKLNKVHICAQFSNFEIDEWDPDNEKEMLNYDKTMNEEVVFDDDGIPIPELDGSVHDLFANNVEENHYCSSDEEEVNGVGQIALHNGTVAHIVDFNPNENETCADEYNFSNAIKLMHNKHIMQVWAGPSHWKLKYIRPNASRFSGQPEKKVLKSTRKTQPETMIDFSEDCTNVDKKSCKGKRRLFDDNSHKCTLPLLLNAISKNTPLMLKPVYLEKDTGKKDKVIDKDMEPYNYENPNDSQYCAENGFGDDSHSGDDGDCINEEGVPLNIGDNLVDVPELVPKTYIPYAMQAKKMDMKKLKVSIWKSLVSKTNNDIVPDDDMYKKEVQPMTFSYLYKNLPKRLTDKMQDELSCPLAFVALLHLANEQNLQFEGQPDFTDFAIRQQKTFVPL